jgi:membrane-bound serine protease (ClpP class)
VISRLHALWPALLAAPWLAAQEAPPAPPAASAPVAERRAVAYVIPVQDQIAKPTLYILRRGLKEAIEQKADLVVLDMKTPGGDAGVTVEIMEALERFEGATITFVNDEAGSAGAIIASVTDDIYFAPTGVMGAAELILGTGQDAPEALKRKMESYIRAKSRALSSGEERRADVLKAMMNADFELKIGDKVLKPKGELLTLSAQEAVKTFGEPPTPLLAAGIAKDIDELLTKKFGAGNFEVRRFRVTWSESLAQYLTTFAPVLMGLGLLALFVEYKTPGFGWPGISGIVLLAIVFFGHYTAGLSGHEPALLFGLGLLLLAVELIFFPGVVLPAVIGVGLMLGSLLWAMADVWPDQPIDFSGDLLVQPAINLGLALVITAVGGVLLVRFLPKSWFWDRLVLSAAVSATAGGDAFAAPAATDPLLGARGVALTAMFPSGEVEVDGRRYQAHVELGHVAAGDPVVVKARAGFSLVVERLSS